MENSTTTQLCALEAYLPPSFLVNVLAFLDVASRFRFAASSRAFREIVFGPEQQERGIDDSVKSIWAYMDFSTCTQRDRDRLTDYELRLILKRVNALEFTKGLFLEACVNLTGIGLAGLHGSNVLEEITMVSRNLNVSKEFLDRIFRPMAARKLCYINIQSMYANGTMNWKMDSRRQLEPCRRCGIWKYDCALSPCYKCGTHLCHSCSSPTTRFNKCALCAAMMVCLPCYDRYHRRGTSIVLHRFCKPCKTNLEAGVWTKNRSNQLGGG
ncbi:expressed unknown protein [Seminavis robusta]|uniref:F-box domain-containing protein n=1 Tax=Seminavis robusta TaxID=568900 RepID=A0A9N8DKU4_9STRA|nr:expressed unknown protein [Seminavis robusta]|eukprot:Sro213_g088610.1 n/a (269) ;mRNA; f:85023-85829